MGMKIVLLHSKIRNIPGFIACQQVVKLLLMRYINSLLGKVAGA